VTITDDAHHLREWSGPIKRVTISNDRQQKLLAIDTNCDDKVSV